MNLHICMLVYGYTQISICSVRITVYSVCSLDRQKQDGSPHILPEQILCSHMSVQVRLLLPHLFAKCCKYGILLLYIINLLQCGCYDSVTMTACMLLL